MVDFKFKKSGLFAAGVLFLSLIHILGSFLLDNFDIKIVQTWKGCVIAAAVIAFPLMYRNARAAFEQVDVNLIYAGQTLGCLLYTSAGSYQEDV